MFCESGTFCFAVYNGNNLRIPLAVNLLLLFLKECHIILFFVINAFLDYVAP